MSLRNPSRVAQSALVVLVLCFAFGIQLNHRSDAAGAPIYPDLQTAPPAGLYIEKQKLDDGRNHYLLRFNNQIENHGGPLEIVANLQQTRDLYQNVYDQLNGGTVAVHKKIAVDLIFHPTHNHFHVTDFANYDLYVKSSNGVFRKTSRYGAKTSFCIVDSVKIDPAATNSPVYTECNAQRQGMDAGWGDIYTAALPDQWIDLGTSMIKDGDYALHSTADPRNRILESNDDNNTAVTQFSIKNGKVVAASPTPYCAAKPAEVQVGGVVTFACSSLTPGHTYAVRWRLPSSTPVTTAVADLNGDLYGDFTMPPTTRGAHYLYVTDTAGGDPIRAALETLATLAISPSSGGSGAKIAVSLTGFTGNAQVSISYALTKTSQKVLATVTTNGSGSASTSIRLPATTAGTHLFRAVETSGGTTVTTEYVVRPTMSFSNSTATTGGVIQVKLRGFGSNDLVNLSIVQTGDKVGSIRVNSSGAADPGKSAQFTVPSKLAPGTYTVLATGTKPKVTVTQTLIVTGPQAAEAPPTATQTHTPSPTPTPTATSTQAPTATPTRPQPRSRRPPSCRPNQPPSPPEMAPQSSSAALHPLRSSAVTWVDLVRGVSRR